MSRDGSHDSTLELTVGDVRAARRVSLLIHYDGGAKVVLLLPNTPVVVGRKAPSDVHVPQPSLSRAHARFSLREDEVWLEDLETTNGCFVDGQRVTKTVINTNSHVRMGHVLVTLHVLESSDAPLVKDEIDRLLSVQTVVVSPAMKDLYRVAERVARSPLPVLIGGETGVGKEVLARAIHASGSSGSSMRCLNCGAVPRELIESVLFGHEKGSFTGAENQQRGIFEDAGEGTVLLDEIGELSPTAQVALLRVLEDRTIRRIGGSTEIPVHARVIAATHRNLEAMVEAGEFRQDLFFRLNVLNLDIPPLRERTDEILPLARAFAQSAAERDGLPGPTFDPEFERWMLANPWTGNVRELRNVVERAVLLADEPRLTLDLVRTRTTAPPKRHTTRAGPLKNRVRDFEVRLIVEALEAEQWNRSAAARALDMPLRTLTSKMQAYGIVNPKG